MQDYDEPQKACKRWVEVIEVSPSSTEDTPAFILGWTVEITSDTVTLLQSLQKKCKKPASKLPVAMTSFSDSDGGRALLRLLSRGHAATQQRLNRLQGCQQIQMNLIQDSRQYLCEKSQKANEPDN